MAQHLSLMDESILERYGMRSFAPHVRAIKKKARNLDSLMHSLRYEKLHDDYKLSEHDSVFITRRSIHGNYELFEVHYDRQADKLTELFLVK